MIQGRDDGLGLLVAQVGHCLGHCLPAALRGAYAKGVRRSGAGRRQRQPRAEGRVEQDRFRQRRREPLLWDARYQRKGEVSTARVAEGGVSRHGSP